MLDRLFKLSELGTDVRTEVVAGATTFMTMCYILVVNPQILSGSGMPVGGVLFATCICSAVASIVMGLFARYPVALAPGMGLNAYFALVAAPQLAATLGSQQAGWRAALGAVFISGTLFLLLTAFRVRESMVRSVPASLKLAISSGIGLLITLVGLRNGGLVVDHPQTLLTLGNLHSAAPLLTVGGLVIVGVGMARGFKGSVLLAIVAITLVAVALGQAPAPNRLVALPDPAGTWLQLDIAAALSKGVVHIIFAFFFVDLFDTLGTLIGVAEQGNLFDAQGNLPRASRALFADAVGTLLGAIFGTSTVTSYVESASGIAAGGRSGLTAVVTGLLFGLSAFFWPLLASVPTVATAPVLIVVGALMARGIAKVPWNDITEALPAFATLAGIAFTFSIADGMALGFVSFSAIKLLSGRARDVGLVTWIVTVLFVLRYALLA